MKILKHQVGDYLLVIGVAVRKISLAQDGGNGSGNFNHSGRPGKIGGSGEGSCKNEVDTITKEEYGKIMHELNNNLTKEQRQKKKIIKAIGNYVYTVKNDGFNEYKIIRKVKISEFN